MKQNINLLQSFAHRITILYNLTVHRTVICFSHTGYKFLTETGYRITIPNRLSAYFSPQRKQSYCSQVNVLHSYVKEVS